MVTSWARVGASVIVTVPVCCVTVPANAAAKSSADPDKAPVASSKVIDPVVAALMVTSWARVGASVIVTLPTIARQAAAWAADNLII